MRVLAQMFVPDGSELFSTDVSIKMDDMLLHANVGDEIELDYVYWKVERKVFHIKEARVALYVAML